MFTIPSIATDPTLSAVATLKICLGGKAQALHRDDWIWQQRHSAGIPGTI